MKFLPQEAVEDPLDVESDPVQDVLDEVDDLAFWVNFVEVVAAVVMVVGPINLN